MTSGDLTQHFNQYFEIVLADTEALRKEAFRVRHQVYCEELGYEPINRDGLERDNYDDISHHCLLLHKETQRYVGCIRVIPSPNPDSATLPFIKLMGTKLNPKLQSLIDIGEVKYSEISRLAITSSFRRRPGEQQHPDAEGTGENNGQSADSERRRLPSMSIGLYLAATAICEREDIGTVIAIMEPRLARLLNRYGLNFEQAGDAIEHRGIRAPFVIYTESVLTSMAPDLKSLLNLVRSQLYPHT